MGSTAARRRLRGVIFDMDGTLTVPNHDFAEMYRRVGCETKDILTEIEGWSEAERERAYAIIHEMESEALATMRRMPGAATLGAFLDARGLPRGLVTRNVQASVAHFHANAWPLPPFAKRAEGRRGADDSYGVPGRNDACSGVEYREPEGEG